MQHLLAPLDIFLTALMNQLRDSLVQKFEIRMSAYIEAFTKSMKKKRSDLIRSKQAVGRTGKSFRFVLDSDNLNIQILRRYAGDTPVWSKIRDIEEAVEYMADDPELVHRLKIGIDSIEAEWRVCQEEFEHAVIAERERGKAALIEELGQLQREFQLIIAEFQLLAVRELIAIVVSSVELAQKTKLFTNYLWHPSLCRARILSSM